MYKKYLHVRFWRMTPSDWVNGNLQSKLEPNLTVQSASLSRQLTWPVTNQPTRCQKAKQNYY